MSIDPHQDRHTDAREAEYDTQSDAPPKSVGIIVDPQGNPYRQKSNPYQKLKRLVKSILDQIPHGERMMILLTAAVAVATIGQFFLAWWNSHEGSKQIDSLIVAADRIDDSADSFSRSASQINSGVADAVSKLDKQAMANHMAAKAAESAAHTAKDALHISERAYVAMLPPQINLVAKSAEVRFINNGQIPTGPVSIRVYEITNQQGHSEIDEGHWTEYQINEIPPKGIGEYFGGSLGLPALDPESLTGKNSSSKKQGVALAGTVSYDDGFGVTQNFNFCVHTFVVAETKELRWLPCDPIDAIPKMQFTLKYPNNYQKATQ